jgi:hypothetical protein
MEDATELEALRETAHAVFCRFAEFPVARLIVEWPKVYPGARGQADPDDLMPLCGIDAALAVFFLPARASSVRPREWKGTIPKAVKPKGKPWPPYAVEQMVLARLSALGVPAPTPSAPRACPTERATTWRTRWASACTRSTAAFLPHPRRVRPR